MAGNVVNIFVGVFLWHEIRCDDSICFGGGNVADQAVNAALRYRAQVPLLDSLLGELGLKDADLSQALSDGSAKPNGAASLKQDENQRPD